MKTLVAIAVIIAGIIAPGVAQDHIVDQPHATVYVYHMRDTPGGWWVHPMVDHPYVYVDGQVVQKIIGSQFFHIEVPAGKHLFTVGRFGKPFDLPVELSAGETYYIRMDNHAVALKTQRPWSLVVVKKDQAESQMVGMKETFALPPGSTE